MVRCYQRLYTINIVISSDNSRKLDMMILNILSDFIMDRNLGI